MASIKLPFGKSGITAEIPDDRLAGVLRSEAGSYKAEKGESEIVQDALDEPIDSPKLSELAKGKNNIVMICSDHTRPVPSKVIAPLAIKEIRKGNAGLHAIIRESGLIEVINKKAVFEFDPKYTFHINAANLPKNKNEFKGILKQFLNEECEVEFITKKEVKHTKVKTTIKDVYEELKNEFGEIVEYKQED